MSIVLICMEGYGEGVPVWRRNGMFLVTVMTAVLVIAVIAVAVVVVVEGVVVTTVLVHQNTVEGNVMGSIPEERGGRGAAILKERGPVPPRHLQAQHLVVEIIKVRARVVTRRL